MFECRKLVEALNGLYNGTYCDFEKDLSLSIENYMSTFYRRVDSYYHPSCIIEENLSSGCIRCNGVTIGIDKVIFDKRIINGLKSGEKRNLLAIFHELAHIKQNIQIENGVATPNVIKYIKDILLNQYQELENKCSFEKIQDVDSFYDINYKVDSREIDAELSAILYFIEFCMRNNIDFSKEQETLIDKVEELIERKKKKRNLQNCNTFNSYYLTLEDAFDVAIKYHPEWLDSYPQLKVEYILVDGIIMKNSSIVYDEYDENSDIYHRTKILLKN